MDKQFLLGPALLVTPVLLQVRPVVPLSKITFLSYNHYHDHSTHARSKGIYFFYRLFVFPRCNLSVAAEISFPAVKDAVFLYHDHKLLQSSDMAKTIAKSSGFEIRLLLLYIFHYIMNLHVTPRAIYLTGHGESGIIVNCQPQGR